MSSVPAVAFAWLNPEALRVFLDLRGFNLCVATGDMATVQELDARQRDHNFVILPNFQKRHLLSDHVDKIGWLLLLTNGRHVEVMQAGIPILDSDIQDGDIHKRHNQTANWYIQHIQSDAKPLDLGFVAPKLKKVRVSIDDLATLDQWLNHIDQYVAAGITDFSVDIEQPVCLYLVGEVQRKEFQAALRVLVKRGASKKLLRQFYTWLSPEYAVRMRKALRYRLHPKNVDNMPDAHRLAKKFSLDANDIGLMEAVYGEIEMEDDDE